MEKYSFLFNCFFLLYFLHPNVSQYNIKRINPFKELSFSLRIHHIEGWDGGNISLQCPEGTKVRSTQYSQEMFILLFHISIQSVQYGSPNQSCTIQSSLRRVEAECQSQANCFLSVTPQNLIAETEDPCPLSKKKVEISFQYKSVSF